MLRGWYSSLWVFAKKMDSFARGRALMGGREINARRLVRKSELEQDAE